MISAVVVLCGGRKCLPVNWYSVVIFTLSGPLGLLGSGVWKKTIALAVARGREWCCSFLYLSWTDSIKPSLLFSSFVGSLYFQRITSMILDYLSHLIRLWHFSSNTHAQLSSGAKCVIFSRALRLLPYFMCANSEGSGETARGCAGSPEPSLVAYVIRIIITWAGSFLDYLVSFTSYVWFLCKFLVLHTVCLFLYALNILLLGLVSFLYIQCFFWNYVFLPKITLKS